MSDPFSKNFDGVLSHDALQRLFNIGGGTPDETDPMYAGKGRKTAGKKQAAKPVQPQVETLLGPENLCLSYKPAREQTPSGMVYFHTLDVNQTIQDAIKSSPEDTTLTAGELEKMVRAAIKYRRIPLRTIMLGDKEYKEHFKKVDEAYSAAKPASVPTSASP